MSVQLSVDLVLQEDYTDNLCIYLNCHGVLCSV